MTEFISTQVLSTGYGYTVTNKYDNYGVIFKFFLVSFRNALHAQHTARRRIAQQRDFPLLTLPSHYRCQSRYSYNRICTSFFFVIVILVGHPKKIITDRNHIIYCTSPTFPATRIVHYTDYYFYCYYDYYYT